MAEGYKGVECQSLEKDEKVFEREFFILEFLKEKMEDKMTNHIFKLEKIQEGYTDLSYFKENGEYMGGLRLNDIELKRVKELFDNLKI